ncbi:MAG: hypothetical protein AAF747_08630, partial [Planctomycetota bacterium]
GELPAEVFARLPSDIRTRLEAMPDDQQRAAIKRLAERRLDASASQSTERDRDRPRRERRPSKPAPSVDTVDVPAPDEG